MGSNTEGSSEEGGFKEMVEWVIDKVIVAASGTMLAAMGAGIIYHYAVPLAISASIGAGLGFFLGLVRYPYSDWRYTKSRLECALFASVFGSGFFAVGFFVLQGCGGPRNFYPAIIGW